MKKKLTPKLLSNLFPPSLLKRGQGEFFILLFVILLTACSHNSPKLYNGYLEADVIQITALNPGKIVSLPIQEGMPVTKDETIAEIDHQTIDLKANQQQLQLQEITLNQEKLKNQKTQLLAQWDFNKSQLQKIENMLQAGAATALSKDELQTKNQVYSAEYNSLQEQAKILDNQKQQLMIALKITAKQIQDSIIKTPISGLVLTRYHLLGENINLGGLIAEIADISNLTAVIYLPIKELAQIKLGQTVQIYLNNRSKNYPGQIKWISSQAEFTPKTIMTSETQSTLVYQVKISVPNPDKELKIGLPVEVGINNGIGMGRN